MFRNQYDNDITTWSPQGRLHQIEYAFEAVNQGSACVGLRSHSHAVLVALNRAQNDLASYQNKVVRIDDHMGIAFAGLSSDARVLSNYMRTQAMQSKMLFGRPLPTYRIVSQVADKAQINTQKDGYRPYGVGLLVIGYDDSGAHLYECSPSGNFYDYLAISIGARSQSAKTYLEKHFASFENASLDELIVHGLTALRDTLSNDKSLTTANVTIGIVGKDKDFQMVNGDALKPYLERVESIGGRRGNAAPAAAMDVDAGAAPMDTE